MRFISRPSGQLYGLLPAVCGKEHALGAAVAGHTDGVAGACLRTRACKDAGRGSVRTGAARDTCAEGQANLEDKDNLGDTSTFSVSGVVESCWSCAGGDANLANITSIARAMVEVCEGVRMDERRGMCARRRASNILPFFKKFVLKLEGSPSSSI